MHLSSLLVAVQITTASPQSQRQDNFAQTTSDRISQIIQSGEANRETRYFMRIMGDSAVSEIVPISKPLILPEDPSPESMSNTLLETKTEGITTSENNSSTALPIDYEQYQQNFLRSHEAWGRVETMRENARWIGTGSMAILGLVWLCGKKTKNQ